MSCWKYVLSLYLLINKGLLKKYVRWGGEGGGGGVLLGIEKQTKTNRGRGVLAFMYVCFLKKNAEIFKVKFYSYSPVFSDYNGSMKY